MFAMQVSCQSTYASVVLERANRRRHRSAVRRSFMEVKVDNVTEQEIRNQFFRTRDAATALANRTARVDATVIQRWLWMPQDVALLAVGGYGRSELFPYSDIDLLILTPDEKTQFAIKEPLSMFLRDLWDRGLRISQSVHTPADCNQIDSSNAELAVSLLDRRLLAGNEALFRQIRDPRPDLGRNIVQLTNERHAKFHGTIYHLEPNVKDSPGGLRDLQVLRWLARLGAGDHDLPVGVPVLFEIRCFLHYLGGRDDNKLTFERQDEIATLNSAVSPEALMRQYYRAARRILHTGQSATGSLRIQTQLVVVSIPRPFFQAVQHRFLGASRVRVFPVVTRIGIRPRADLAAFRIHRKAWLTARAGHRGTCRAECTRLRAGSAFSRLSGLRFGEILRLPHVSKALRAMHETRALEAIFPELSDIDALVIRDFYHRYTVDEHTLVAIESVLELRGKKEDTFGDLASETDELDLLIAALLFHDVGKGTPDEGHVTASRRIAEKALRRSGISDRAWDVVAFLISAHLEMLRRDEWARHFRSVDGARRGVEDRHKWKIKTSDPADIR